MMLEGKTAIVTGAGKGIGKGIALALAKEGCRVVPSDIDIEESKKTAKEIKSIGAEALAVKCDVSKKRDAVKMVSQTKKKFGKPDILVNNAGIFPFVQFSKMTEKDWDKVLDVNLKSVFLCTKEALKQMKKGGKIVCISSIAAIIGFPGLSHYCASKGGMSSMVRALSLELAERKINVNAIAPGAIDTPGASKVLTEKAKKQTIAQIPLARMGTPEDIANAVVFLASEKSDYITGQTIIVDGGWTLH